jgi:hypothetical protein
MDTPLCSHYGKISERKRGLTTLLVSSVPLFGMPVILLDRELTAIDEYPISALIKKKVAGPCLKPNLGY